MVTHYFTLIPKLHKHVGWEERGKDAAGPVGPEETVGIGEDPPPSHSAPLNLALQRQTIGTGVYH